MYFAHQMPCSQGLVAEGLAVGAKSPGVLLLYRREITA